MSKCWRDVEIKKMTYDEVVYLLKNDKILKHFTECIDCDSSDIKTSRENMIRCKDCNLEWSIRKGSILEGSKVPLEKFVLLYSLYNDGISSHKASKIAFVNKNTANKFFKAFKHLGKEIN